MNLNSLDFFVFMIVVMAGLRFTRGLAPAFLLAANYFFYATWNVGYLPIIIATSMVDFFCAQRIESAGTGARRKAFLWLSLGFNISLLIYFKYAFRLMNHFVPVDVPVIPIGLSFHTFQSMGYVLDVYRRRLRAETSFSDYANYVSFFPQLIAGPIERAGHLLPQLKSTTFRPRPGDTGKAAYLIFLGLFMTLGLSENLAQYSLSFYELNTANSNAFNHVNTRLDYLLSVYTFPFTLYLRFAGYSYLAQGSALLLGIELTTNFKFPFFSKSMAEFWGRWHISLSKWIRDYVFLPLSAHARSNGDLYAYIFVTMWLFGIWHQASLGWVIASTILAAYSVLGHVWRMRKPTHGLAAFASAVLTFHVFALAMIFVNNLTDERTVRQFAEGLIHFARMGWGPVAAHQWTALKLVAVALAVDAVNFSKRDIFGLLQLRLSLRIAAFSAMILFLFFNLNADSGLSMYFRM